MPSGRLLGLIRYLYDAARAGDDAPSDAILLRRFTDQRDESAFTELVQRYGPLVLGVCHRVLGNATDAEDAFQATFLVLARQARSVTRPGRLGGWLHRVAFRIALRARAAIAHRRDQAVPHPEPAVIMPTPEMETAEVRRLLDEEIDRLPERLRRAVVMCYLEGRSLGEAAQQLGCPAGTVASRLATARERLRGRLLRRGIGPSAGALAALLAADALRAAVPAVLVQSAVRAALSGGASVFVMTLAKGALRAMLVSRIRSAIVVVAVLAVIGAGVGYFGSQPGADGHPQDKAVPAAGEPAKASRVTDLLRQRRDAASRSFDFRMQQVTKEARVADDNFFAAALRLHDAEMSLSGTRTARIEACQAHLERMKQVNAIVRVQVEVGKVQADVGTTASYFLLDAEVRLERAKEK